MYTLSDNLSLLTVPAGEAIVLELQLRISDAVTEPLAADGRTFALSVYDDARTSLTSDYMGELLADDTGEFVRFIVPGDTTKALYQTPSMFYDISEGGTNEQVCWGQLAVSASSPTQIRNSRAPVARSLIRIIRTKPEGAKAGTFALVYRSFRATVINGSDLDLDFSSGSVGGFGMM